MVRSVGKTGQLDQEGTTVPITVIFTDLVEILTNPNTRDPVLGRIGIGMAVLSPAVVLLDITRTIATVEIAPLLSLNSGRSKDDTQQERDETKRLLQHDVYLTCVRLTVIGAGRIIAMGYRLRRLVVPIRDDDELRIPQWSPTDPDH